MRTSASRRCCSVFTPSKQTRHGTSGGGMISIPSAYPNGSRMSSPGRSGTGDGIRSRFVRSRPRALTILWLPHPGGLVSARRRSLAESDLDRPSEAAPLRLGHHEVGDGRILDPDARQVRHADLVIPRSARLDPSRDLPELGIDVIASDEAALHGVMDL